jgi:hypothetical protein
MVALLFVDTLIILIALLLGLASVLLAVFRSSGWSAQVRLRHYYQLLESIDEPCLIISRQKIVAVNERLKLESPMAVIGENPWDIWKQTALKNMSYDVVVDQLRKKDNLVFAMQLKRSNGVESLIDIKVSIVDAEKEEFLICSATQRKSLRTSSGLKKVKCALNGRNPSEISATGTFVFIRTGRKPQPPGWSKYLASLTSAQLLCGTGCTPPTWMSSGRSLMVL